jgi:hypothetical protein
MRISLGLLVCLGLIPISMLALISFSWMLPPDTDQNFRIHVRRGRISLEGDSPAPRHVTETSGGGGEDIPLGEGGREKNVEFRDHDPSRGERQGGAAGAAATASSGDVIVARAGNKREEGWVKELALAYGDGLGQRGEQAQEGQGDDECERAIAAEMLWENPRQERMQMIKKEGRWPASGPDSGGGEVLFYPQTQAAKQSAGVSCQFGASVLSGGYDAFNGLVACTPPPRLRLPPESSSRDF